MNFSGALENLKNGKKLFRYGWNGKGLFVEAQFPDAHSKMGNPYLFMDAGGIKTPWIPSQTDLFAEDWNVVKD